MQVQVLTQTPIIVSEIKPIYLRVLTYDAVQYIYIYSIYCSTLCHLISLDEDRCSSSGLCFLLKNFSRGYLMKFSTWAYLHIKFFSAWKSIFIRKNSVHILGFLQLLFLKKPHALLVLWSETFWGMYVYISWLETFCS
jgi:hypothetical protein